MICFKVLSILMLQRFRSKSFILRFIVQKIFLISFKKSASFCLENLGLVAFFLLENLRFSNGLLLLSSFVLEFKLLHSIFLIACVSIFGFFDIFSSINNGIIFKKLLGVDLLKNVGQIRIVLFVGGSCLSVMNHFILEDRKNIFLRFFLRNFNVFYELIS